MPRLAGTWCGGRKRLQFGCDAKRPGTLGDDIRDQLILQQGDLVPQPQLALLQPGELELVGRRHGAKRLDGGVEIAMLHSQPHQSRRRIDVVDHAFPLLLAGPRPAYPGTFFERIDKGSTTRRTYRGGRPIGRRQSHETGV